MDAPIAALLLLVGAIIGLALLLTDHARERAIAQRTELIAHGRGRDRPAATPMWQARLLRALGALFAFRMRRSWGVATGPLYLLAIGALAAALLLLGGSILGLSAHLRAVVAMAGFILVPRILLIIEQRRTAAQFAELLADAIEMIVRVVRAGLPVSAAIRTVAKEAAEPVSTVFTQVADQAEIGVPLDEALARVSSAIGNPDFRFLAVAVALQQSTGGNLVTTLETLAEIIRKRRVVRLKAYSATAEVRLSAMILGAIPFFVTGALLLVAPTYLNPLFSDPRGHVILGVALFGLVLGGITMRGLIRHALSAA